MLGDQRCMYGESKTVVTVCAEHFVNGMLFFIFIFFIVFIYSKCVYLDLQFSAQLSEDSKRVDLLRRRCMRVCVCMCVCVCVCVCVCAVSYTHLTLPTTVPV